MQQYHAHSDIFLFAIRPYACIEEMPDCTQSVAFQMRSSFERIDFCLGEAKICRNTRLFQGFLTKPRRKDTFQNLMACCSLKYL